MATRRQRVLSRAKRGSRSRCKKRLAMAKAWQRATERERGVLHELTADLVRGHGARFYVEDLKIPNMVRNHRLARSISEQNLGDVCPVAHPQSGKGWWVGAQGAPASHVAAVRRLRGLAGGEADAGRSHLCVRGLRLYGGPRRECSEECPCRRACARPAGRGSPGAPQGGRGARC